MTRFRFALFLLAAAVAPLAGQVAPPTARDSTFSTPALRLTDLIDKETRRSGSMRKTQTRAWNDTLTRLIKALVFAPPPVPNAPPIARFTLPVGGCVATQICTFDASTSTDDKAVVGYRWNCGATPNCNSTGKTASIVYGGAGSYTVSLTVVDADSASNAMTRQVAVTALPVPDSIPPVDTTTKPPVDTVLGIVPPALPRSVPDFQPKPCSVHKDIAPPMNLQTALNSAQPGDCLDLAPGAKWQGSFTLPSRTCTATTAWTTVQTKGITDVPGTRILPSQAAQFATITQVSNQYAITAGQPTCNWQLVHLNITRDSVYTGLVYHLLVLGASPTDGNTSLATQPRNIIVRRSWIHGTATGELVRCVVVNGINLAIVDSWIDDCHASGFDSQAVEGWNGAGPILIANNFLAGAGENVMFGGADPADSTLRPSDITILRNHFYKDPTWKGKWSVKNGFESKNSQRMFVDGNVWQPCAWASSQVGMCIVIKSSTGGMTSTVPSGTTDLTFTNNRTASSNRGFNIQGQDCTAQACGPVSIFVNRVIVQNNLFDSIGTVLGLNGQAWMNPMSDGPKNVLVRNNTFVTNLPGQGKATFVSNRPGEWQNIRWRNNIFGGQADYALGADCAQPTHMAALDCMIGAGNYTFSGNVLSGVLQTYWGKNPPGNTYKVTLAELGLQPDGSTSSFPGVGADIAAITQKTAGVVVGMDQRKPPAPLAGRRAAARRPAYKPTTADSAFCARSACTIERKATEPRIRVP